MLLIVITRIFLDGFDFRIQFAAEGGLKRRHVFIAPAYLGALARPENCPVIAVDIGAEHFRQS